MKAFVSLLLAAAASLVATTVMTVPVRAEAEYPWCAHGSIQGGSQSCTFATIEQCRAYVSGGGFCQTNPRASALAQMPKRSSRR